MANYSYIHLHSKVTAAEFESVLRTIIQERFEGKAVVVRPSYEPELGCLVVWEVEIPGTAQPAEKAGQWLLAPNENIGISIQLDKGLKSLVFRHSPSSFEDWFRGVVRELLALHYETQIYFDASDSYAQPTKNGQDRYNYPSFGAYMRRNFAEPLVQSDLDWFEALKKRAPEGWW